MMASYKKIYMKYLYDRKDVRKLKDIGRMILARHGILYLLM